MNTRMSPWSWATLLLLLALSAADVSAQADSGSARFWLAAGLGVGTFRDSGVSGMAEFAVQEGTHLFAVRGTAVTDVDWWVADIALLYGRASTSRATAIHYSGAIGVSLVTLDGLPFGGGTPGTDQGGGTIGVAIAGDASGNTRFFGLGLKGFANLNTVQSFAGVIVSLKVGRLS